jgi:hypothetical protein
MRGVDKVKLEVRQVVTFCKRQEARSWGLKSSVDEVASKLS